jgi:hypothetical protein
MGGEGKSFEIESGRREIFCERVNPPYDREDPPPTRLIGATWHMPWVVLFFF